MLRYAEFAIEFVSRDIEYDRIRCFNTQGTAGTHTANDSRSGHIRSLVWPIGLTHVSISTFAADLDVKSKINHVAILHYVLFAFDAGEALFQCGFA